MQSTKMATKVHIGGKFKYAATRKIRLRLMVLASVYVVVITSVLATRGLSASGYFANKPAQIYSDAQNIQHPSHVWKRDVLVIDLNGSIGDEQISAEENANCTERSVNQFPGNFFTLEQTEKGGFIIHIIISLYMFGALALVCDDYFVASLEMICDGLGLQENVAGATFMAAGSSAPELFTSVIAVFIAKSDVGVGTIVGSAVFNILVIVAICALFAGMVVYLTWWPMVRDCSFYLLSLIALIVVIHDGVVHWYEGMVMLIMYILYIVIMYFNRRLESFFNSKAKNIKLSWLRCDYVDESEIIKTSETSPLMKNISNGTISQKKEIEKTSKIGDKEEETEFGGLPLSHENEHTHAHEEYDSPWTIPESFLGRIFWVGMVPVKALLFVTIPDCRWPGKWQKLYLLTFAMSIVWIAGLSYLMVWMVTIAGDALGIPDTVMGLTFLAAGTSVPDAMSSLLVARDGLGDMAVSNTVGSNVFDVLVCLGLPWLIHTTAIDVGGVVEINSKGLVYSSITLLSTVAFLLIATHLNRWKLNRWMGVMFLIIYAIVITLSCLFELNVFGDLNLPSCPRE